MRNQRRNRIRAGLDKGIEARRAGPTGVGNRQTLVGPFSPVAWENMKVHIHIDHH
jgi:hypothetical protein